MVKQHLTELGIEYKSIDVTESPESAAQYGVMSVPVTLLIDDKAGEISRSIGFKPNELNEMLESL